MFVISDLIIRSCGIGICLLITTHFALIRPISRKTISTIALLLSASGMIAASSAISMQHMEQSYIWNLIATTLVAVSPALIAWGILELFEDNFRFKSWQIALVAFSVPTHFLNGIHPVFGTISQVSSIMIYAYLFYVTITNRTHDLVHERRMFHLWFMGGAAIAGITFTSIRLYYGDVIMPPVYYIFKASVMSGLILIFAYWALKVRERVWALPQNLAIKHPENLSHSEMALLTKLKASVKQDIWREDGLTIRRLSEILEAPEHRLRKVINQGLGYRNFTAFVNEHRIGAACEVLSNPVKADIPVTTIAYELGYASLGPFNRAFKDIVGESPSEFRKRTVSHA